MAGRRAVRRGTLVAGMVAVIAACGGGSGDDVSDNISDDAGEVAGALVGTLVVIDPEVTLDGSAVDGSADVRAGSAIETDGAGFAELGLRLGSLLRIDVGTSVEVLELSDDGGAVEVRTRVESGRTWSRTGDLGADDSYVVETPVAVAETSDGAFVTECNDIRCTFTVLEGSLDVELPDGTYVTVDAPASVEARDGTLGEPVIVPFDGAFGDPWLTENNALDVEAGHDDVVAAYAELDPALASLTGTFTGNRTVTDVTCDPACSGDEAVVGEVAERSYTFDIDCSKSTPCTGTVDTEYVINDQVVSGVQPLTFDGTTYRWAVEQAIPACQGDATGEVVVTIEWALAPATAELRDGDFVVTTLDGEITATNVVTAPGTCTGDRRSDSSTSSVSVAR
jgi:hypothetical protein